ncbi:MAG: response regulator, partial [Chloroflexi bacterium]|nr:response regulator [Chloroflexota bacterium]
DGDWKRWQLALQRGEVVHDFEAELRRQDGTRIDVRCSARIWRDADGTMLYYEGSLEDVTERVRAGRLLQALSEASLSMARAITQDSILAAIAQEFQQLGFSCTLLLLDEGRVNLVAHPLHQDMAQPQEGVPTGQGTKALSIPLAAVGPYAQAIHEQKTVFVQSATDGIQQAPPESGVEATGQPASTPQASTFIAAPLVVEAQVIGVLSVESVDLSEEDVPAITAFAQQVAAAWHKAQLMGNLHKSLQELRDTQAQLLQAQKLESLGRLAGGIAHDFSNLLTVMIGYAQLSLRQLKLRHPIHKYVSEIYVATQRATRMTGQLLDFARQQTLHREPVHLGRLIRGFSEMLGPMIGEHIQIELNLAGDLPVLVDRMAFERVLMNLALNARDAMPEGGTLFIATAQVDIDAAYVQSHPEAKPGDYVRVTVSDAGIGMDQATLEHLFEPFFSTKPPDQGIGLGLAVTYGIVKQHEGWITVKSTLGQGTTFQLYIPICLEVVEKTTEESQVLPMLRGQGTVLLAEDETTVRHFMQEVLEGLGYTVLPARDGREAIRVFRDHRDTVDLAILDVVMPKLSGVKVCDALRKLRSDVPVIFITGYSKEIPHLPGPGDTVTRILQKPFGPDQLSLQVREVMEEAVLATALP